MRHHVGIDLGTTNSAICSYDGSNVRIWKSPEQNDVTPSAIYIDRRGNRHHGLRAYDMAPADEKNAATLFKRYMGTSERFTFERAGLSLSPEECSAEILKVLFGYLPEDVRGDPETATVITVPAAFNQVKKEATLEAARMAGIGRVALMQEPVAAIMAVMRAMRDKKQDGIFVVYDLGGGTFDVSIAQAHSGKVDLLTQDGKEMCGGRDWDRRIFNSVVIPWLKEEFDLPKDLMMNEQYRTLCRVALRAVEGAKIELSSSETSVVHADETVTRSVDVQGKEIYLEVPLSRAIMEPLIDGLIDETIEMTRAAMQKAGLKASDIENIVFVGGPTKYAPLRDKVSEELALKALPPESVDPMTAVAEGAAIFAEAIDWSTEAHARKPTNAGASLGADISIRYEARATGDKAKIAFQVGTSARLFVEITSADTGWTSGRAELRQGTIMELPLSKEGGNSFRVVVYDEQGRTIPIQQSQLVITRTLATVGAIPASRSIRMVVLNKIGGTERLDRRYLIRKDEPLPKKGQLIFKAAETLKAGSDASLNFQLYEGEIESPHRDNRLIGTYKISGKDFDSGIIPTGAELICDYEVSDAGTLSMRASVPCLGADFERRNFFSHSEGKLDLEATDRISQEGLSVLERIDKTSSKVDDPRLDKAREKAGRAASIGARMHDREEVQAASDDLLDAKELLDQTRRDHKKETRQLDLDGCVEFFNETVRRHATPDEAEAFDAVARAAQRSIDRNDDAFEAQLDEMRGKNFVILWKQDWFVIDMFNDMARSPYDFADRSRFEALKRQGLASIERDQIGELRKVIIALEDIRISRSSGGPDVPINILEG